MEFIIRSTGLLAAAVAFLFLTGCKTTDEEIIMTVKGPVNAGEMGITLTHEHVLVDFIGARWINEKRWNRDNVAGKSIPFLNSAAELGIRSFIDATPAYLGRDPRLLRSLSQKTGLHILTNTGYYGAGENKYLPEHAFSESAEQIATRWIEEWKEGIEGTTVKPGFIKIGVAEGNMSDLHRKLVKAAAITHRETGMVIASHTGRALPAFTQLGILYDENVSPEAFIWVHSQSEADRANHVLAASAGAWISFDGVNDENTDEYIALIKNMKDNDLLDHVLLSHDAGWFDPAEDDGGNYRDYNSISEKLVPALIRNGFTDDEIRMLLVKNPAEAFAIRVRKIKP